MAEVTARYAPTRIAKNKVIRYVEGRLNMVGASLNKREQTKKFAAV